MKRRQYLALALVAVAVLAWVGQAAAERSQFGNVIVSLSGGITPRKLPREGNAPVAVHLSGGVRTTDASSLPRVNRLKLELAWRGKLNVRGLPVCPAVRLRGLASSQALDACGPSLVGDGGLAAQIYVPGQEPFNIKTNLLAFNGRTKVGRRAVLVHAYTSDPPISFVIPFVVHRSDGAFQTVLVTTIRRSVGTWPHVASFHINIGRKFQAGGRSESYLLASCPVPKGFTAAFSIARATYVFAGGDEMTQESVRGCRARQKS